MPIAIENVVRDDSLLWKIWNLKDIYTGPNGTGVYVPKVGDEVHDIVGRTLTRLVVTGVSDATLLSTLESLTEGNEDGAQVSDSLLAPTPYTYRVMVDESVTPHRLNIDSRCYQHSLLAAYCKVFLGTNISASGRVISAWYDNQGVYQGEGIPMEVVASERFQTNVGIKVAKPAWTNEELTAGDLCTAVFYALDGTKIATQVMSVFLTGFVRASDAYIKAVQSIALESPFLTNSNTRLINYPVNLPLNALNLVGVVNFSDGSQTRLAVDDTRFSVEGLRAFSPTVVGDTRTLTLKYRLQSGEIGYGSNSAPVDHFSETYQLTVTAANGTYSVVLFCYPVWVNPSVGYRLSWFLYDLNRSISYDVTSLVVVDGGASAFVATQYGGKQTLSVSINLRSVDASYNNYTHVQFVDVVLNNPGTVRPARNAANLWNVANQAGAVPMFGNGAYATFYRQSPGSSRVSLKGDQETLANWMRAFYELSRPLYDPSVEAAPPAPSHFKIVIGGVSTTYPISQWSNDIAIGQALVNGDTLFIEFILRTIAIDLQLSKIGVPLWEVDAVGTYL